MTLQQTGSGAFNNAIFGPGSLTLNSGTVTLAGANSYTGGTIVNGGMLNLTGSITGDLAVGPNATFVNSGTVNSPGYWLSNQGTFTNSGTIAGNFANVANATNTGTFTGSVINGSAGAFVNNGNVGGDFLNMGVLSGNGTIGGSFFNTGVMAPGNSIGTINVAGNFVNAASGTYLAEVVGQGQSDRITVGGAALLQGGTVVVSVLPGLAFAPSTTYTLLSAAGGLSGTFALGERALSLPAVEPELRRQQRLSHPAGRWLRRPGAQLEPVRRRQRARRQCRQRHRRLRHGARHFGHRHRPAGPGLHDRHQRPELCGLLELDGAGRTALHEQLRQPDRRRQSARQQRVALAEACDVACDPTQPPQWGAWGGGLGGLGTIGANQPLGTVTYNVGGFAAGLDRAITPTTRLGVTAGYTTGTQWVGGFDGVGRTDTFQTGLYGGYSQDKVYADAVVGYAYGCNQMWRNIPIPGLQQRTAQGRTGANQFYGQAETGYRFDLGGTANAFVTPFARLQAYTGTQNAFTETGAQSLNLTVAQQTTNSLRSVHRRAAGRRDGSRLAREARDAVPAGLEP